MKLQDEVKVFLSNYSEQVISNTIQLREILIANLPDIIEQVDSPAKMIAYCYGSKYKEMICAIFPSKKGLKISFYDGINLPDPAKMLDGKAKTSRYVQINDPSQIDSPHLKILILEAFKLYIQRIKTDK